MLLVVNIVGGVIIVYGVEYIKSEEFSEFRKRLFISLLFLFLGVMNLLVVTNSLEIFFLTFELTTLFSYLLIRYRGDKVAIENSIRALWVNQIGGIAILVAIILSIHYIDTIYLDILLKDKNSFIVSIVAILTISAFVKGASIPFEKWLLGAMVAPTPVSAILHSATMVKIAPYLILKISPAFTPIVSLTITIFGAFVFMSASILALNKDYFKEILGLSTIAVLSLIMAIASIRTKDAFEITIILIIFHAISKALLFLQAGILEKQFYLKYISDINYLIDKSKLTVWLIIIGFASLTLPPFGVFLGKLLSIELIASLMSSNSLYILPLIFVVIGSTILVLLYFKIITRVLNSQNLSKSSSEIVIKPIYKYTSIFLATLIIAGVIFFIFSSDYSITLISSFIVVAFIVLILFLKLQKVSLTKEYNCAEKDEIKTQLYYFDIDNQIKNSIPYLATILIVSVVIGSFL
jgi:ech hydrogenase subunit A